ncbi:MAG: hypothetical protein FJY85_12385, partial [Deltaproteobacteria bacterium]|nr:hypothetical protein [Deltaproteobacteria bacterium]
MQAYVREYNIARSRRLRERVDALATEPARQFLEQAAQVLLEFIYDVIEKGRRRALREIWTWAREGKTDEGLRRRLLDYLQETEESKKIEKLLENASICLADWRDLADQAISVREVHELRGQVVRSLESTPDHPGLLYLRAICEALLEDGDRLEVFANAKATLHSMVADYRSAVEDFGASLWEMIDSFEGRALKGLQPVLDAIADSGVKSEAARVFLR